jgi:hypothetical protein
VSNMLLAQSLPAAAAVSPEGDVFQHTRLMPTLLPATASLPLVLSAHAPGETEMLYGASHFRR